MLAASVEVHRRMTGRQQRSESDGTLPCCAPLRDDPWEHSLGRGMQIRFSEDDLARVRLSPTLDPFEEIQTASHDAIRRNDPARTVWAHEAMDRLGAPGPGIVRELRSPLVQFTGLGIRPDGMRPFEFQLDRALSQPTTQWRAHTAEVHWYGLPIEPALGEGRHNAVDVLGRAMWSFHSAAIAPHWANMSNAASTAVRAWTQILSRSGVEGLFQQLHASGSWVPPVLSFRRPKTPCPPGCAHPLVEAEADRTSGRNFAVSERGLTIVPSVFRTMCVAWVVIDPVRGPAAEILTVPIRGRRDALVEWPPHHGPDPLARLLGAARCSVLSACSTDEMTTSGLAHTVGISLSSASEHAAALRGAGLITSRRDRNRVLHQATPMGLALVRGSTGQIPAGQRHT